MNCREAVEKRTNRAKDMGLILQLVKVICIASVFVAFNNVEVAAEVCQNYYSCLDQFCCGPGTNWSGVECVVGPSSQPLEPDSDTCYNPKCTEEECCGPGTYYYEVVDHAAPDRALCIAREECCTNGFNPDPQVVGIQLDPSDCDVGEDIGECGDSRRLDAGSTVTYSMRRKLGQGNFWVEGTWTLKEEQRQLQSKGDMTKIHKCRHRDRTCTQNFKGEVEVKVTWDDKTGKITSKVTTGRTRKGKAVGAKVCGPWSAWTPWVDCILV